MIPDSQTQVAAFLQDMAGAPPIETHISAVFRGADTVWKLKKAVRLSFVDFSDLADRRRFLERELALNSGAAPGLYRDVAPVRHTAGGLAVGPGPGQVLDWVLRMARAREADFLDHVAERGGLDPPLLDALADAVADLHAALPPARVADPVGRLRQVASGNAAAARAAGLPAPAVDAWMTGVAAALEGRRAVIEARAEAGLVRRAHGDLHLGNFLLWHGRPAPFDALEFSEELATIDLGYDLAFLLMDLDVRVSRAAANRVLGRYVGRTGDAGLVGLLPVFLSLRAMVRAHVTASRGGLAAPYLSAALAYLRPDVSKPAAMLLAIGGLMGTGKTTLARALAPDLGPAPGALVIRSDEVRKRLHGVRPERALQPETYTADSHQRTDAALLAMVQAALAGGHAVIADATFLDPALRDRLAGVAREAGAPFLGVWLHAPQAELERRIMARTGDASDATVAVLLAAASRVVPPKDWRHVEATEPNLALAEVRATLPR